MSLPKNRHSVSPLDAFAPVCLARVIDTHNAVTSTTTTAAGNNLTPKTDIRCSFSKAVEAIKGTYFPKNRLHGPYSSRGSSEQRRSCLTHLHQRVPVE